MSDPASEPVAPFNGSAVLIVDAWGRVLLQQRDDDRVEPGYGRWSIPGGGREGDETPRQTAVRELEEEIGVHLYRLRHWGAVSAPVFALSRAGDRHIFLSDQYVPREGIVVNEGLDFQYHGQEALDGLAMNPRVRQLLDQIMAGPLYGELAHRPLAAVIGINRWGELLVQRSGGETVWRLPVAPIRAGEAPDSAALRIFEAAAGHRLDKMRFAEVLRPAQLAGLTAPALHLYYDDADVQIDLIDAPDESTFTYLAPAALAEAALDERDRALLQRFVAGNAYRAMFH